MLFEAATTLLMGGIALKAHLSKNALTNDSQKIQKIFALSGLNVKDGNDTLTAQLVKRTNFDWGTEYRYRLPLGRSFEDYKAKMNALEDGLNNRRARLTMKDLQELQIDSDLISSVKALWNRKLTERKELELSFDGLLILRVYDEPLPKRVEWEPGNRWKVPMGITREKNETVFHDFEKTPHIVLGGATRYGKSNLINGLICSLLSSEPEHTKLYLIDLKGGVELCDYENAVQTASIAYEPEEALVTLTRAYDAMRATQKRLRSMGKKNVQEAGLKERSFIIIDEVGELNPSEAVSKEEKRLKEECQTIMSQIARLGAGLGFRQVLATQYPTGDVIPRQCKQNSDVKICFRVQNGTASRVVLDETGAEELPQIKGRAIVQTADEKIIVQTPLITSDDIKEVVTPHIRKEVEKVDEIKKIERPKRKNIVVIEEV